MSTTEVPGPPGVRRRRTAGPDAARILSMRDAERVGVPLAGVSSLLQLAMDAILLVKDLVGDPRVPRREKTLAALAAAYVLSPVDLVPSWVPVLGKIDDLLVLAMAGRRLLRVAGYELVYERWRGTEQGLATVLTLAGVEE